MKQHDTYKVEVLLAASANAIHIPEDVDEVLYRIQKSAELENIEASLIFDIRDITDIERHKCRITGDETISINTDFGEFSIVPSEYEPLLKLWMKRSYRRA